MRWLAQQATEPDARSSRRLAIRYGEIDHGWRRCVEDCASVCKMGGVELKDIYRVCR